MVFGQFRVNIIIRKKYNNKIIIIIGLIRKNLDDL